jgi:hypothetical protein
VIHGKIQGALCAIEPTALGGKAYKNSAKLNHWLRHSYQYTFSRSQIMRKLVMGFIFLMSLPVAGMAEEAAAPAAPAPAAAPVAPAAPDAAAVPAAPPAAAAAPTAPAAATAAPPKAYPPGYVPEKSAQGK